MNRARHILGLALGLFTLDASKEARTRSGVRRLSAMHRKRKAKRRKRNKMARASRRANR